MADIIQVRRDTASNWTSANPTLASGELGLETDTGKLKIGTGATAWTSLSYYFAGYNFAPLASPTFTGTVTGPTINASTALQIGGAAVTSTAPELNILDGVTSTTAELNILDGVTSTAAELNKLDGVTSTTAELNILDGVTSTAAELNKLDGVTATTAELNYVDGVTSAIQTQIDAKGTGTVSSLSDLSITSTAAELNALDGIPAGLTATELGYVDGVTSAIQTQINSKGTGTVSNLSDLSITSTAAELNKLDALSRGSIIYGNASGATTVLTKGTSAQVLTSDGTDIAWAAASGGGGGGVGNQLIELETNNGYGSTATAIRKYATTKVNVGDDMTLAVDSTNATRITINTTGIYAIYMRDRAQSTGHSFGASLNAGSVTAILSNLSTAQVIMYSQSPPETSTNVTTFVSCSRTLRLEEDDIVRPHSQTTGSGDVHFSITRVA